MILEARVAERDWFDRVPKVELHLHLEGAIPHEALWDLIQKYGGDKSVTRFEDLQTRFEYRDFPHFIETWAWKNGFLREYEDSAFVAEAVARTLLKTAHGRRLSERSDMAGVISRTDVR